MGEREKSEERERKRDCVELSCEKENLCEWNIKSTKARHRPSYFKIEKPFFSKNFKQQRKCKPLEA
jgi:hypothetical protein